MNAAVKTRKTLKAPAADAPIYVTMQVDGQAFGIEVTYVRDVLRQQKVTPILLAPPEVAGALNLRGRIVTVIDLRRRLNLPPRSTGPTAFVVLELKDELYALMVDSVGEVLAAPATLTEPPPANLSPQWKAIASGICKLDNLLLVLVNVQTLLKL